MKKLILLIIVLSVLNNASAFAGSCVVPKFLKEGTTIEFNVGMGLATGKILEIDKKTCWIKIQEKRGEVLWINPNALQVIEIKK